MRRLLPLLSAFFLGCPTLHKEDTADTTGSASDSGPSDSGGPDSGGDSADSGRDTSEPDVDTDTDVDTAAPGFRIGGGGTEVSFPFGGDCAAGVCVYYISTTEPAGLLELDITETGDAYLYNEHHTGFTLAETHADGSSTYRLELAWVTDLRDVVANETTLFNDETGDGGVLDRSTWYFGATSADGTATDCIVAGHDPGYYADWCTRVFE